MSAAICNISVGMDHKAFVASLPAEIRNELTSKSDWQGVRHLALHLAAIAICAAYVSLTLPFWPLAVVCLGISIIFLFTLQHETTHFTPFQSRWLNHVVGAACGFVLVLPPTWFRYFHLAHHRHTQDPKRDPELASPKPATLWDYAIHVTGLGIWKNQALALVKNAFRAPNADYIPASRAPQICIEARVMLAAYATLGGMAVVYSWAWVFWLWILPLAVGQPFLRLYLLAEHTGCDDAPNMFRNTRTTFTSSIIRFLAWNMPYHAEHHAFPTVPFHALPRLHELCKANLRVTQTGYARFNRELVKKMTIGPE